MADAFIFRECKGKRVVRVASMRKKEGKKREERKKKIPWKRATLYLHINQSRLELLAGELARLITKIDFIAVSGRIEINIFNCTRDD